MQVESTSGENEYKVWLNPDEYAALEDYANERGAKHYAAVLLGGRVGLRAREIAGVRWEHVWEEGDHYRLRVPETSGKDTTGSGGKARDAYLPRDVERDLLEIRYQLDRDEDERLLGVTTRRVRQLVEELGEEMAAGDAGDVPGHQPDWRKLSTHDLRRYYAQDLLVREEMNPRVVMAVGGWDSMDALTPYLTKPTEDVIHDEFEAAGWA